TLPSSLLGPLRERRQGRPLSPASPAVQLDRAARRIVSPLSIRPAFPIIRNRAFMNFAGDLRAWLLWVIKIRFLIITLVFSIDYGVRQVVHSPGNLLSLKYLGSAVILWYLLGLFYLVYYQLG